MLLTLVSFAFVISVLVFIHELGHYLAARSTGMRVEKFSVGFPPRFLSFTSAPGGWDFKIFFYKRVNKKFVWAPVFETFIKSKNKKGSGTEYCLALLPLGGYVKVSGILDESMDPDSTGAEYEYQSKKTWQKLWFTSAGVIFNFILAFIIFVILLSFSGYPKNKINLVVDKIYPDLIEDIKINGKQLKGDDFFYSRLSYSSDTLKHRSIMDNSNGYIFFENLVADDIEKIEVKMPFNINSFSEGLSEDSSSVKINFKPGEKYFSINAINGSSALSERGYYIGKINHASLDLKESPVYGRLFKGDRILSINNGSINQSVKYSKDIIPLIEKADNLDMTILSGEDTVLIKGIEPIQFYRYDQYGNKESFGRIGVGFEKEKLSFFELLNIASNNLFEGISGTAVGIFELITGQVSAKGASGPIGIAKMSGEFASAGFLSLLSLMAMLSISLGVINILPFPGLDGGHALIAIIEKLKGSKISAKTLVRIQQFGMFVLLSLFILIFLKDLKII